MSLYEAARAARRALDERLERVGVEALLPPRAGHVRAVREALGMSRQALGTRLRVSRQAIAAMETSEIAGTVRMSTLAAAAAALDCRLVYALVPNTTLEGTVKTEAGRIVDVFAADTAHTMALENQAVELSKASRADHIDDVIRNGQLLWRTDLGS